MNLDRTKCEKEIRQLAPKLSEPAFTTLSKMYSSISLDGTEKRDVNVGETFITILQGAELNRVFRQANARSTLEIGFAFGFSTIWILDAIGPHGCHEAIDPYEKSYYGGVGIKQVQDTVGFADKFKWHADLSILKISEFIREKRSFDAIFIDGNHRFDDVIVDFYLSDYVLNIGGIIAIDDIGMEAIKTATSFIQANRNYEIVENKEANMLVLKKTERDTRRWDHFVPFEVPSLIKPTQPEKRSRFSFRRKISN